jgi:membrane peptidoglycan carboxypeptidase
MRFFAIQDKRANHAVTQIHAADRGSKRSRHGGRKSLVLIAGLCLFIGVMFMLALELWTSALQARYLSTLSRQLTYQVAPGPSSAIHFPTTGPYDERLGYTLLPAFTERLIAQDYRIAAQARLSPRLQQVIAWGLFPVYDEKTQTGLRVLDRHGEVIFKASYPRRVYTDFETIPKRIVDTLLFIENRELLDPRYPRRNPVVEWDRLARAIVDAMVQRIDKDHPTPGGSTLATQIEKFRHSPGGRTDSALEKLRQMVSASLRAYHHGAITLAAQRKIILDYLNALPLSAQVGHGEVRSLGDGLWAWYHADFGHVNGVLSSQDMEHDPARLAAYALAYKQVLSLLLAHRRPSFYLQHQPEALAALTDHYLHLLSRAGLISPGLRDAALQVRLQVLQSAPSQPQSSFVERKAANVVRRDVMSLLGLPELYGLDRLDLSVQSTLDRRMQDAVTAWFHQWRSMAAVRTAGLTGPQLLDDGDPAKVRYSLVLYERQGQTNLLRINTDNLDQPFDLNQGLKLDLGSTAKLRTLITYLELVAELHNRFTRLPRQTLPTVRVHASDRLTQWALHYVENMPHTSLLRMLDAAMERRFSASPEERFFTGGAVHTFVNFSRRDNNRVLSVREALCHSVNLVFIRLMREVVQYYQVRLPEMQRQPPDNGQPAPELQNGFSAAAREHRQAVYHFFQRYAGKRPEAILDALSDRVYPTPQRLATVYGALEPNASLQAFTAFLRARFPHHELTDNLVQTMFERFVTADHTWADRGHLTAMQPLELRVAAYLYHHPNANGLEVAAASGVSQPLASPPRPQPEASLEGRDRHTLTRLEERAFQRIHAAWQRLGYPFASLVPSYATAIGSSADRPEALAELIGIIASNGVRYPYRHIRQLHFASGTPYETLVVPQGEARQVLHPAIAAVVKEALFDVVEQGTARRLQGAFRRSDDSAMRIGAKTGTGDHRYKVYGANGKLLQSRVMNRAAALVFMIDERFFGTLTVYVPGPEAANYHFTSALPVRILKVLAPTLQPLLQETGQRAVRK